jgi:hypothetical protein
MREAVVAHPGGAERRGPRRPKTRIQHATAFTTLALMTVTMIGRTSPSACR